MARAVVNAFEVAPRMPEVIFFRKTRLGGELLSENGAYSWAFAEVVRQGEPTCLVVERFGGDLASHGFQPIVVRETEILTVNLPETNFPARADGPLGELRALAHRLADQFGWDVERAALWVLTGQVHIIPDRPVRYSIELGPTGGEAVTWNRVQIEAPAEMSGNTVAALHRRARLEVARKQPTFQIKGPPIGARQIAAMIFAAQRNDGRSWESLRIDWNEKQGEGQPEWIYQSFRPFARDVRDTYRRIMGRSWAHGLLGGGDDGSEATDEG